MWGDLGRQTKEFVGGLVSTISQNIASELYGVLALSLSVTPDYTPKPETLVSAAQAVPQYKQI